ncbi:MAG TPA: CPBP family glutamic-type intramembrane protease [Rubrivivax sp.]|nr:CPBP family glutamic-type intramembrane protease [Rubrivivax sp.]
MNKTEAWRLGPLARRAWPLLLLGTIGVLSLLLQPVPAGPLARAPELANMPPLVLKAVLLVNPQILVVAAALLGAALAHRVGLASMLAGTASSAGWRVTLSRAAGLGFALGLGLAAADAAVAPLLGTAWQALLAAAPRGVAPTLMGLLYGGLAEEVMLRWGAMSLFAWLLHSLLRTQGVTPSVVVAIALAALLFAVAHVPALAAQVDLTPAIVARTVALNSVAGLLYGWCFWRHHLEAAMAAHASTHLALAAWHAAQAL